MSLMQQQVIMKRAKFFKFLSFMGESNAVNYVDDTTLCVCDKKLSDMQRKMESESLILYK